MRMPNRVKNIVLFLLVVLAIALIGFSLHGLLQDKWEPIAESLTNFMDQIQKSASTSSAPALDQSVVPTPPAPQEETGVEDLTYQKGANPDIDDRIQAELERIIPEWNVWEKEPVNGHYYMKAGEYAATFQNTTGVSFPRIKFVFSFEDTNGTSLQKVDLYDGPLEKEGSIVLPVTVDQSGTYAHGTVYWGYEL